MYQFKYNVAQIYVSNFVQFAYCIYVRTIIRYTCKVEKPTQPKQSKGVTHGKRQQAPEHLTGYSPEDVRIFLQREKDNTFDKNAVKVVVSVRNKGAYTIGYIPRALAAFIAPLLDTGKVIKTAYSGVARIKAILYACCTHKK